MIIRYRASIHRWVPRLTADLMFHKSMIACEVHGSGHIWHDDRLPSFLLHSFCINNAMA